LQGVVEREKFLRAYMPFLSMIGSEANVLFIRDSKTKKISEVHLRDRMLWCSVCESSDCIHVHYALALPETAKLYLKSPRQH
jgi:hypothetical protein